MTRKNRLRRVGILCCHCLRNLAFRKAGWRRQRFLKKEQFWINADGNFLDVALLEWCKLFADPRGKHYWSKVVTEKEQFFSSLLNALNMTSNNFDQYVNEVRAYRDKFIAHLDDEEVMQIPRLDVLQKSVSYLYDYILSNEDGGDFFVDAPKSAESQFVKFFNEGKEVYEGTLSN